MNNTDIENKIRIINEIFDNEKKIKCNIPIAELQLDENIRQEGDFFLTEDGEFVDLEFLFEDFMEEELVELAESLYEKYGRTISIYVVCPENVNVYVREFDIPSDSNFTIKIAKSKNDPCKTILNGIKHKIKNCETLSKDDLNALDMLPRICRKEEKHYYMLECFKIKNRIIY